MNKRTLSSLMIAAAYAGALVLTLIACGPQNRGNPSPAGGTPSSVVLPDSASSSQAPTPQEQAVAP